MVGLPSILTATALAVGLVEAHSVITYPGWRGNSLHTNGTEPIMNPGSRGMDYYPENNTWSYPWGMQWMYPCGGMPQSTNRTNWPVTGGAVSVQPGWFPGHSKALIYINIGIQTPGELAPPNMSHPVVPPFQITGPTNFEYPGQFCIPQVGMPANVSLQVGQNITLQVVEAAQHGAALYSCVDLTLTDPSEVEPVTPQNCYNSSDIGFNLLFTTSSLTSSSAAAAPPAALASPGAIFALALVTLVGCLL